MFILMPLRICVGCAVFIEQCPVYKQADSNDHKKNIEKIHFNSQYFIHDGVENAEGKYNTAKYLLFKSGF